MDEGMLSATANTGGRPESRVLSAWFGREGQILALSMAAGAAIVLLAAQVVLERYNRDRLYDYAGEVLQNSVSVALESRRLLAQADQSMSERCTDDDLTQLRLLAFQARFIADVGRIENDRIICTAMWGRLAAPQPLPAPTLGTYDGIRLWTAASGISNAGVTSDLASQDDTVVFTSPASFDLFARPRSGFSAQVVTRDGSHEFQRFGDAASFPQGANIEAPWYTIGGSQYASACTRGRIPDICVKARYKGPSILGHAPALSFGLGGLGAAAGSSLGLLVILRRRAHASLSMQLRRALARGTIKVHYQPLMRIRDRRPVGAEALSRWTSEEGDAVSPDVFIRMAQEGGFLDKLTRHIVSTSLEEMRHRLTRDETFYLSINVTAADMISRDFRDFLNRETALRGIKPDRLALEITERSTVDHGQLIDGINRIRKEGYRIYVDDFGTGYSSLAYLSSLPIDAVKIDRMFTQSAGTGSATARIVDQICAMVATLQVSLIAEGMETEAQAAYVVKLDENAVGQGWLFGRPVPADRLMEGEQDEAETQQGDDPPP